MSIDVIFETHSITEDNERGIATGWNQGRLSAEGRELARRLGERHRRDDLAAIFTSDLERALETVRIAFDGTDIPVLHDWRLRECDYGVMNGAEADGLNREQHLDEAYPAGESWRQAIERVETFVPDLVRWQGRRILVVGHTSTRWALEHLVDGTPVERLLSKPFDWQPGWRYKIHLA